MSMRCLGLFLAVCGTAAAQGIPGRAAEPGAITYLQVAVARGTYVASTENPSSAAAQAGLAAENAALNALNTVWNVNGPQYSAGALSATGYLTQLSAARWQAYNAMFQAQAAYFQRPTWSSSQAAVACWYAYVYLEYALTIPLPPAVAASTVNAELQALVNLHNSHRQSRGLGLMTLDARLTESARKHSAWMAANQIMSHSGAGGSTPLQRAVAEGYAGAAYAVGENVAFGYPDVNSVFVAWLNSAGHRANIERGDFTHIGVGVATAANGQRYWSVEFGYLIP